MMEEMIEISGFVYFELKKESKWILIGEGKNLVLNAGKLNTERLLSGDSAGKMITHISVGTSGTSVSPTDVSISNPLNKPIDSVEFLSGNIVAFIAILQGSDPAMTIREVGLLNSDGVLCHRKVFDPPKIKAAGLSYRITYQVKIS